MTSHELAAKLLELPDVPVAYWQYMGGEDELREVTACTVNQNEFLGDVVTLYTYAV